MIRGHKGDRFTVRFTRRLTDAEPGLLSQINVLAAARVLHRPTRPETVCEGSFQEPFSENQESYQNSTKPQRIFYSLYSEGTVAIYTRRVNICVRRIRR